MRKFYTIGKLRKKKIPIFIMLKSVKQFKIINIRTVQLLNTFKFKNIIEN